MTVKNFGDAVEFLMLVKPFRPYTIVLNDGERLQVDHPFAILLQRKTGRVYLDGPGGRIHVFDATSVSQLIDDIDNQPLDLAGKKAEA